ncbi:MAG: LemA family protein [Lachnospiraceae bacterium]|jgi:LemA protein|nr:LemA family protein [Lachnospiraceae bacterium]
MELIIVLVVIAVLIMFLFNNMVSKKNKIEKSLGDIDTYLQTRYDMLNSLFAQLERELDHESTVYAEVTKNRTGFDEIRKAYAENKNNPSAIVKADTGLSSLFTGMRSTFEKYPELQSIQAVIKVMNETVTVENNLNASRRVYNANVTTFRNAIQSFPGVLIANIMGFKDVYSMYKADEAAQSRPKSASEDYYKAKYAKKLENIDKE